MRCSAAVTTMASLEDRRRRSDRNDNVQSEEVIPLDGQNKSVLFEEAIALTGNGKFHHLLLVGCGCCLLAMMWELLSSSYLLPAAECDLGLSSEDKGLMGAVSYLGMITSSHLWGYQADTRGRRAVLIFTLSMDFICALLCSIAPTLWSFLVFRFFNGFFICGPSAVVYAYLGEFHTSSSRTKAIMLACFFISIGIVTLPGMAWLVIPLPFHMVFPWGRYNAWRLFVALCGIPSLLTAVLLYYALPNSPKFLLTVGRKREALAVLRQVYSANTGCAPEMYPVKEVIMDPGMEEGVRSPLETGSLKTMVNNIRMQTAPLFQSPHLTNTLLACLLQFGLYASFNGLMQWLPDIFNKVGASTTDSPSETFTLCSALSLKPTVNVTGNLNWTETIQYSPNDTSITGNVTQLLANTTVCSVWVDPIVFRNTLIIGLSSGVAYLVVGEVVKHVQKRTILVTSLVAASLPMFGLYFSHSVLLTLSFACLFVSLAGMSVSILASVVVDIFPTHLRGMAICLSLMFGRLGTATSSFLLGLLLEVNCALVLFSLGVMILGCGLLSRFLPSAEKKVTSL